ncbi:hypothetical protein POM88_025239 [Heracleum sosnowskyi]|uniref:Uncharacterized protein n=1 Tax=Heracleum sosnowskyi TaxID=360622 RepID=A0AAD8MJM4_9APIA|nr:hypothetical protein POM88_025239 [Heracleum sosnowskyi]
MTRRSRDEEYYIGDRPLLSSFLSANNDEHCYGSFRVPQSFLDEFLEHLTSRVIVKCDRFVWEAKFDKDTKKIYGLRRFMRFYQIKLYNLVQFDYYRDCLFLVKIFKNTAVECDYRKQDPEEFFRNEDLNSWRKEHYITDCLSLEYEKCHAVWSLNAFENHVGYININIRDVDIDQKHEKLVVPKWIKDIYGTKLKNINALEIGGKRVFIFYNYTGGYLTNLERMMDYFKLRQRETIIFTMNNSSVLSGRIFQPDGKEIDYGCRFLETSDDEFSIWFWNVKWNSESEIQLEQIHENGEEDAMDDEHMDDMMMEFSVCLTLSNVNMSSHGVKKENIVQGRILSTFQYAPSVTIKNGMLVNNRPLRTDAREWKFSSRKLGDV